MNPMNTIRRLLLAAAGLACASPASAFTLNELFIDVVLLDQTVVAQQPYSFTFDEFGVDRTGFTISAGTDVSVDIGTSYFPQFGLAEGDSLGAGFVLFDGTLLLEVEPTTPEGRRALRRTTYRLRMNERFLRERREYLRRLYVGQRQFEPERATRFARRATIRDARLLRFIEGDGGGTWRRATRVLRESGRADVRYRGRRLPDDVLGHYGYFTENDKSYVWAVMDRNSRYAVGVNVDDDDDGIVNALDNCRFGPNEDQLDADGDGEGNLCDADDDNDGVEDGADNCPLQANPLQEDSDGDGNGDLCDADDDGDGVNDGEDACPFTDAGATVTPDGCSIADLCPCDNAWKNHGAYVRCVARTAETFLEFDLIDEATKDDTVSTAARSECGARD